MSDDLYTDANGAPIWPLGTVLVTEVQAPDHFIKGDFELKGKITQPTAGGPAKFEWVSPTDGTIRYVADAAYIHNDEESGGISVTKKDADTGKAEPQGNATLAGAVFSIINNNDAPVYYNGTWYNKGQEIMTITADADGVATTGNNVLPVREGGGSYIVKEKTAPTGYTLNTSWSQTVSITSHNQMVSIEMTDKVILGGIEVTKLDSTTNGTPQGNATLQGAQFQIINASTNAVVVSGTTYEPGAVVMTITTNASGVASTGNVLPYGTYTVKESGAPTGYDINVNAANVNVTSNNGTVSSSVSDDVQLGGIRLVKKDSDLNDATAQGDATLAGAEFQIINNSTNPVVVGGKSYAKGQVVMTITAGADGVAATGTVLPHGSYIVKESKAPTGYKLNAAWSTTVSVTKDVTVPVEMTEEIVRGGLQVTKKDADTGNSNPQGDATLAGAEFQIINSGENAVVVNDVTYEVGQVVMTITTDETGVAKTGANDLPYGTYTVKESVPPTGYGVNEAWSAELEVREEGAYATVEMTDPVLRGGISETKRDNDLDGSSDDLQGGALLAGTERQNNFTWFINIAIPNGSVATVVINLTIFPVFPALAIWLYCAIRKRARNTSCPQIAARRQPFLPNRRKRNQQKRRLGK